MKKTRSSLYKIISLGLITWALCFNNSNAQCLTHQQFWNKILEVEGNADNVDVKLNELISLKQQYENCKLPQDSVYARLLHRMGTYQYQNNLDEAINNTINAIRINTANKPSSCLSFAANSYYNVGFYYMSGLQYNKALAYFDSSILISNRFPNNEYNIVNGRLHRAEIFYKKGNYDKDVEETTLALPVAQKANDSSAITALLLERAQSYIIQQKNNYALADINKALTLLQKLKIYDSWANALRYKADIIKQSDCNFAFEIFKQSIAYRKLVDPYQTAIDYNDIGELLLNTCNNLHLAKKYFDSAYKAGERIQNYLACTLAANNLAELSFDKTDYNGALKQNQQALQFLFLHLKLNNSLNNPPYKSFVSLNSKSIAEIILSDKCQFLLYAYKQNKDVNFLKATIATALLNDSLLTDLRHEQTADQSKLYWRNFTRDFFSYAIEASYLNNDATTAFYFIERSRAVLLNDKLNELGANIHLPATETAEEEKLEEAITIQQLQLNNLSDSTKEYAKQLNNLYEVKNKFDRFIKSLEQKYPAYYQYKYADEMPTLQQLQQHLEKNNQSFVHYFLGDTVTYILAITPTNTKFIKLSKNDFNKDQLSQFLQLCADKKMLMNHYDSFAVVSNSIYKKIFQPLQLQKGRIIICADNIVIPFDALCSDYNGRDFLLKNYAFSYVYSARFLLNHFDKHTSQGNFIGFAPVSYQKYLGVQDLKNAATALSASSAFYANEKLFTNTTANRQNFFNYAANYSIINIFSHAKADTTDNEPVLYMQDSLIHLSELQLLNNPATQLVLLSACQTNVGKAATGEGIYSLARGFATAGIPSVSATLWKADEQAIYAITEKFNQYLSKGMSKDEALQKAKLDYINNIGSDKLLPYYWANMILIGNTDALNLTKSNNNYWWVIIGGCVLIILSGFIIIKKVKQK